MSFKPSQNGTDSTTGLAYGLAIVLSETGHDSLGRALQSFTRDLSCLSHTFLEIRRMSEHQQLHQSVLDVLEDQAL